MATEEWLLKAIQGGKNYEELPPRVRTILSVSEWKSRVKDYCIARGLGWGTSQASQVCAEMEYYEELLRYSKLAYRLFPYHLGDYVTRVLRMTAFRYYCDVLYSALKEEKQYDQIPNFTAADIKRLSGIGRNEYIEILNQCKAKRLLWRVNKGIAREFLPTEPSTVVPQPWWHISVVNIGEMEYRALTPDELKVLQDACFPGGSQVSGLDTKMVANLYKRGLCYFDVPIAPDDVIFIPHLEGFVSNRDSAGIHADPLEQLLHQIFVATSENTTVAELAELLSVELGSVRSAVAVACRLGFATRQPRPGGELSPAGLDRASDRPELVAGGLLNKGSAGSPGLVGTERLQDALDSSDGEGQGQLSESAEDLSCLPGAQGPKAVALVVDATVTSYLMMGSLPGLKRHAVTLFEGGRVSGAEPMTSLMEELQGVSNESMDVYEGEMQDLMNHTAALANALEFLREAAPGGLVELLRRESLSGLTAAATAKVLSRAYSALMPVTPMPGLPMLLEGANLVNFGPSAEGSSPWLQLALGVVSGCGLPGVVFVCGQRVLRLPPQLENATHALLWPWDPSVARATELPIPVGADFLLLWLNDYLSRTAVLVQPLNTSVPPGETLGGLHGWQLEVANIPLPISPSVSDSPDSLDILGVAATGGSELVVVSGAAELLHKIVSGLGLRHSVGYLQLMRLAGESHWVPLDLHLGLPLFSVELCRQVCGNASKMDFLSPEWLRGQQQDQAVMQQQLDSLVMAHSCPSRTGPAGVAKGISLPTENLLLAGSKLEVLDLSGFAHVLGTHAP